MTILLLAFPWIAVLVFLVLFTRIPSELPPADALDPERALRVSVVIPARNEAVNIENCLSSIAASTYPDFEIIVVDDRSGDETVALSRSVPAGNPSRIVVIDGEELPEGWLGKPWACWQGAQVSDGEFLLFTDADTMHGPQMLSRAVAGLYQDEADLIGRRPGSSQTARMLEWALADAETQRTMPLYTYRDSYLTVTDWNDTVLWDDISTDAVIETRDERGSMHRFVVPHRDPGFGDPQSFGEGETECGARRCCHDRVDVGQPERLSAQAFGERGHRRIRIPFVQHV